MSERWAAMPGFEGSYEISDSCRARSLRTGKFLAGWHDALGYHCFKLQRADGSFFSAKAHRLVMLAFAGPPPEGKPHVCHNDGNPSNNSLSNLRWDSPRGNAADRVKHGTELRGERVHCAKLTEEDVREIRKRVAQGQTQQSVSERFGVSNQHVHLISVGRRWAHVQ